MKNEDRDIIESYIRINANDHAAMVGMSISEYLEKRRSEVALQSKQLGISVKQYIDFMMIARSGAEEYLNNIM